jgi:hypothetical protein
VTYDAFADQTRVVGEQAHVRVRTVGADVHCVRAHAVEAGWEAQVRYFEADDLDIVDGDVGERAHRGGYLVRRSRELSWGCYECLSRLSGSSFGVSFVKSRPWGTQENSTVIQDVEDFCMNSNGISPDDSGQRRIRLSAVSSVSSLSPLEVPCRSSPGLRGVSPCGPDHTIIAVPTIPGSPVYQRLGCLRGIGWVAGPNCAAGGTLPPVWLLSAGCRLSPPSADSPRPSVAKVRQPLPCRLSPSERTRPTQLLLNTRMA